MTPKLLRYFFVKEWSLNSGTTNKFSVNEYHNLFNSINGSGFPLTGPNGNTITIAAGARNGVDGQGNSNPRSEFENHAVVEYGGRVFDPSYGSAPFSSLEDWEAASISGMGIVFKKSSYNPVTGEARDLFINWIEKIEDPAFRDLNY